jgi:hypothetical protein
MMIEVIEDVAQPFDRLGAEEFPEMREKTVHGIHEHVLPDQRRNRRHDEEGGDHENSDDALSPHRLIEQDGQQDAERR